LPLQPLAVVRNVQTVSLLQRVAVPRRVIDDMRDSYEEESNATATEKEAKEEETILEEMGEREGQQGKLQVESWKARASNAVLNNLSADNGRTASGTAIAHVTAASKLNYTAAVDIDNKTRMGLQAASQLQVSSSDVAFDANRTITLAPVSSSVNGHNKWMILQQMIASLHSGIVLVRQNVAASWVLATAIVVVAVLIGVSYGSKEVLRSLGTRRSATVARSQQIDVATMRETMLHCTTPQGSKGHFSSVTLGGVTPVSPAIRASMVPKDSPGTQESLLGLVAAPSPPTQSSSPDEEVSFLCKQLVVPPRCESVIYVPKKPNNSFHVVDQHGNRLIGVELKAGKHIPLMQRQVQLVAADGNPIAVCAEAPVPNNGNELQLHHGNGQYFATLVPGSHPDVQRIPGPRVAWMVRGQRDSEWLFRGTFDSYTVQVMNRQGRMLAMTQPTKEQHGDFGDMYMLRVAALTDASIILCTLLAVHHLR